MSQLASSASGQPQSLWSKLAPFDSEDAGLPFCRLHLWPLLDDAAVVSVCTVNRATLRWFSSVPIQRLFTQHAPSDRWERDELLLPLSNAHCWPAVTRLVCCGWPQLQPLLPRLQQLRHLLLPHIWPVLTCIDGLLPRSLLTMHITYHYAPLSSSTFPPCLTLLHLEGPTGGLAAKGAVSPTLLPGCLPPALTELYYDAAVVIPCGALPPSLRVLHLGLRHNTTAVGLQPGCLPASLTELRWAGPIGSGLVAGLLPASLRTLQLKDVSFNTPLDGVFPLDSQLRELSFGGGGFVQPLNGDTLPRSLTELDLTSAFQWNHSLDGVLPPALRTLRLGQFFAQPLTVHTFSSCPLLHTLDMSAVEKQLVAFPVGALPGSLTELRCPRHALMPVVDSLPASLHCLHLSIHSSIHSSPVQLGFLNESLQQLDLSSHCSLPFPLDALPRTLQQLQLDVRHPQCSMQGSFAACAHLRHVMLEAHSWTGPLEPHWLPPNLLGLNLLYAHFDSPLERDALPATLRALVLSERYSQAITLDSFASCQQLEQLVLPGARFTQRLTAELLPQSLRQLRVHRKYCRKQLLLPSTIRVTTDQSSDSWEYLI